MTVSGRTAVCVVSLTIALALSACPAKAQEEAAQLTVRADQGKETIDRNIYGHFAEHLGRCIYEGFWVGENSAIPNTRGIRNDVVQALRAIKIPVLRWPGGCFADEYHWRDGIGPREKRPTMVNTHWGGVTENNHFGTHEFMDLCEQLGCEPYVCGNLGSGTVEEMADWVEYITFDGKSPLADLRRQNGRDKPWKLRYFGVGNENWGCGGNMTAQFYADQYRRYQTYVRNFGENRIFKIACGPSDANYDWTEVMMANVGGRMNGLALHYYTVPTGNWGDKGSATQFDEALWLATMRRATEMETLVTRHSAIMDRRDPRKRIALLVDEWGVWHNVEPGTNPGFLYQQNSLLDALVAGLTLNVFNNHCDRVKMANIAQTVNVLQAMILTDGPRMILTPTYYVYYMYTVHHDATLLPTELTGPDYTLGTDKLPATNVSASRDRDGRIHVSLCNIDPHKPVNVKTRVQGFAPKRISGQVLTAGEITAHNTFENGSVVQPAAFNDARVTDDGFEVRLPAKSVVVLEIEK